MRDSPKAVPKTLEDWRNYVAYERHDIAILTVAERDELAPLERQRYDYTRLRAVNEAMVLPTPDLATVAEKLRICVGMGVGDQFTARQGLAVSGDQRLGKSTAAMYLGREHERLQRAIHDRPHDRDFAPVLYVPTPPESSPRQLMSAFARTLALPVGTRVSTDGLMTQVVNVISELGTSLIILDEIQNLRTRASAGMAAANALKAFSEALPAVFMYVGVKLETADLLAGPMQDQINGRLSVVHMEPLPYGTQDDRDRWHQLIMQFEQWFPLAEHSVGSLADANDWLYAATGGVIGSLRTVLRAAQVTAIQTGAERIDVTAVQQAMTDFRTKRNLEEARRKERKSRMAARPVAQGPKVAA